MAATNFDDLADWQQSLLRRPNKGFVLIGGPNATIPASFTSGVSAEFQELNDFESLGYIAKDAPPSWRPEVQSSDIESWGALEPPRTDIISRDMSVSFTAQETRRSVLELYSGIDLSAIEADATTKELQYNDPTAPATRYNRFIFGAVDGAGADTIYILRVLPRATVTEIGEQSWSQDGAMAYNITLKAKIDSALGYSVKHVFCGPGIASRLGAMGFTAIAAVPVITSHVPAGTLAAAGGDSVALLGQHFTGTTGVTVGGDAASFTVINDTTLSIVTPPKSAGAHNVVVTNATGPSANYSVTYA